jgi:hypothetical protein
MAASAGYRLVCLADLLHDRLLDHVIEGEHHHRHRRGQGDQCQVLAGTGELGAELFQGEPQVRLFRHR